MEIEHRRADKLPTFIDVFAGCGGLSLGLMSAGWRGLFAIEKDAFAFQTLRANLIEGETSHRFDWPTWLKREAHSIGRVLEEHPTELASMRGKVDMLVGGPPCQGFSSAGRRDPNDPRNQLVESYLRLVSIVQPKVVLIENVRGITQDFKDESGDGGRINYSEWLTDSLAASYVVSTRMLDTSTFGVPQRRQRFFVIAIRKDVDSRSDPFTVIESRRLGFLRKKGIFAVPVTARSAISDFEIARAGVKESRDTKGFDEIAYDGPLTPYQRLLNQGLPTPTDTRLARHSLEIGFRFQQIIQYCHANGRLSISLSPELKASFGLKKCAIRVLDPDGASPTITSMPDDLIHYSEPRTLTVRENARLQSFPDWFAFHGKYTTGGERRRREVPRFTQVANAVPPLVAEAIGGALIELINATPVQTSALTERVGLRIVPAKRAVPA